MKSNPRYLIVHKNVGGEWHGHTDRDLFETSSNVYSVAEMGVRNQNFWIYQVADLPPSFDELLTQPKLVLQIPKALEKDLRALDKQNKSYHWKGWYSSFDPSKVLDTFSK